MRNFKKIVSHSKNSTLKLLKQESTNEEYTAGMSGLKNIYLV